MRLNKFLVALLAMILIINVFSVVAFAESGELTKEETNPISSGNTLDDIEEVTEEKVTSSDENPISKQDEVVEKLCGEKLSEEIVSGDEKASEEVVSGEALVEENTSGEVVVEEKVSGEVLADEKASGEALSGETVVEETSGEKVDETVIASDVKDTDWYAPFVKEALEEGFVELDDEGRFYPKKLASRKDAFDMLSAAVGKTYKVDLEDPEEFLKVKITREEVSYVIYNYIQSIDMGFKGSWMFLLDFEDRAEVTEEYYESIAWCVMNKILIGRPDNTLGAQDYATRAELATIVVRLMDYLEK